MISGVGTGAFELKDAAQDAATIGAAYMTHLFLHEMGHQVVADEVGADFHEMRFFTNKNGKFYLGLSTYQSIPEDSLLPYAVAGEWMSDLTFELALQSYRHKPSAFKKSLMFFSCMDFLLYTLYAYYDEPDNKMYDPNLIREETGLSSELLLSLFATISLLNAYRIFNPDAKFRPLLQIDKKSAALLIQIDL
jgi:hypothetical protein